MPSISKSHVHSLITPPGAHFDYSGAINISFLLAPLIAIGKVKLVSFSLFIDAFPPRPKMPFTYVVNVYSDMSLSKGHLGSRGGGGGGGSISK